MEERKISKKELEKILKNHSIWLETNGAEGEKADFSHCWLYGIDEDGNEEKLNLEGAVLDYADFSFADLSKVRLNKASLKHAELMNTQFNRLDLYDTDFSFANLIGASFKEANLESVGFDSADLRGASFRYANLKFVDFSSAKLQGANFCFVSSGNTCFKNADVKYAQIPTLELGYNAMEMNIDERQAQEMMYYLLKLIEHSKNISKETKNICEIKKIVDFANKYNYAKDYGEVKLIQ